MRNKHLGFFPLNNKYENSEAHHIDIDKIIYIPKSAHQAIKHNLNCGKNMDKTNYHAFLFLEAEELYALQ